MCPLGLMQRKSRETQVLCRQVQRLNAGCRINPQPPGVDDYPDIRRTFPAFKVQQKQTRNKKPHSAQRLETGLVGVILSPDLITPIFAQPTTRDFTITLNKVADRTVYLRVTLMQAICQEIRSAVFIPVEMSWKRFLKHRFPVPLNAPHSWIPLE